MRDAYFQVPTTPTNTEANGGARADLNPYHIWVSEIMLQQTQVATVAGGYFQRFIDRFPTVAALAAATDGEVMAAWAGLGFYRRARNLHAGAQHVVSKCGGVLPSTVAGLLEVPGIGPYTAGAVASIAHGVAEAAVDGNVIRVLARLDAQAVDPKARATAQAAWRTARALVDPAAPGAFNSALMELGAVVCTPAAPSCGACPLREGGLCKAYAAASASAPAGSDDAAVGRLLAVTYPLKAVKKASPVKRVAALVLLCPRPTPRLLFVNRGQKQSGWSGGAALLAGQWLPPSLEVEVEEGEAAGEAGAHDAAALASKLLGLLNTGMPIDRQLTLDGVVRDCGRVTHVFSHVTHSIQVLAALASIPPTWHSGVATSLPAVGEAKLVALDDIEPLGLSTWACRVLHAASAHIDIASSYLRTRWLQAGLLKP
jgi:A/G-specific adenine glycosylase